MRLVAIVVLLAGTVHADRWKPFARKEFKSPKGQTLVVNPDKTYKLAGFSGTLPQLPLQATNVEKPGE